MAERVYSTLYMNVADCVSIFRFRFSFPFPFSISIAFPSFTGYTTPTSSGNQNVLFRTEYLDSIDANGKGEGKCT